MKIEKLIPSKKVKDRYYIELENGQTLRVNINLIADYSLYTGRELNEDELESLCDDSERSNAHARALRILGQRGMSRKEIIRRLEEKGERPAIAEETADWLEKIGVLNDEEYAENIVRHYAAKGYGMRRIKDELYRRGVPRDMWEQALENLPEQEEQEETILRFVRNKLRGQAPDMASRKRVSDALLRRGFSWDEIKYALSAYESEIEEADL